MPQDTKTPSAESVGRHGQATDRIVALIGTWRRFGPYGPRYEILSIDGAREATIRVHTSGEITKYAIADILADPVD